MKSIVELRDNKKHTVLLFIVKRPTEVSFQWKLTLMEKSVLVLVEDLPHIHIMSKCWQTYVIQNNCLQWSFGRNCPKQTKFKLNCKTPFSDKAIVKCFLFLFFTKPTKTDWKQLVFGLKWWRYHWLSIPTNISQPQNSSMKLFLKKP